MSCILITALALGISLVDFLDLNVNISSGVNSNSNVGFIYQYKYDESVDNNNTNSDVCLYDLDKFNDVKHDGNENITFEGYVIAMKYPTHVCPTITDFKHNYDNLDLDKGDGFVQLMKTTYEAVFLSMIIYNPVSNTIELVQNGFDHWLLDFDIKYVNGTGNILLTNCPNPTLSLKQLEKAPLNAIHEINSPSKTGINLFSGHAINRMRFDSHLFVKAQLPEPDGNSRAKPNSALRFSGLVDSIGSICRALSIVNNPNPSPSHTHLFSVLSGYNMNFNGLRYWYEVCREYPLTIHMQELLSPFAVAGRDDMLSMRFNIQYQYRNASQQQAESSENPVIRRCLFKASESNCQFVSSGVENSGRGTDGEADELSHCRVKFVRGNWNLHNRSSGTRYLDKHAYSGQFHCIQDVLDVFDDFETGLLAGLGVETKTQKWAGYVSPLGFAAGWYPATAAAVNEEDADGNSDLSGKFTDISPATLAMVEYLELAEVVKAHVSRGGVSSVAGDALGLHVRSFVSMAYQNNEPGQTVTDINKAVEDADISMAGHEVSSDSEYPGDWGLFGNYHTDTEGNEISCSLYHSSRPNSSYGNQRYCLCDDERGEGTFSSDCVPNTQMLLDNAKADIHVLVFVPTGLHVSLAQEVLQSWRENCELHTCQFYSRYTIFPIAPCGYQGGGSWGSADIPYTSVILTVDDYVNQVAAQLDIVVVLVGLEALLSFENPGGMIPSCEYGHSVRYSLPTPLVFGSIVGAAELGAAGLGARGKFTPSIDAFGGTALAVKRYIHSHRTSSWGAHSHPSFPEAVDGVFQNNKAIRQSFIAIAIAYCSASYGSVDKTSLFFKFNNAGSAAKSFTVRRKCWKKVRDSGSISGSGWDEWERCSSANLNLSNAFDVKLDILRPGENAPEIEFGTDLPNLRRSGGHCGAYAVNESALQETYSNVIDCFNNHQWVASTIKALYTLETLLIGLREGTQQRYVDEECSVTAFKDHIKRSDHAALKFVFVPVFNIFQTGVHIRLSAGRVPLSELKLMAVLFEQYLVDNYRHSDFDFMLGSDGEVDSDGTAEALLLRDPGSGFDVSGSLWNALDVVSIHCALASILVESSRVDIARSVYTKSIVPVPYQIVRRDRALWRKERQNLSRVRGYQSQLLAPLAALLPDFKGNVAHTGAGLDMLHNLLSSAEQTQSQPCSPLRGRANYFSTKYQTHFITVASQTNAELDHLLYSASKLSGIKVTVLGLDKQYVHYGNKVQWTYEYVLEQMELGRSASQSTAQSHSNHKSDAYSDIEARGILDDDVIVFMDAYDVLLFPSVRNMARSFEDHPTPIVFCSEHGLYPEFSSGWMGNKPSHGPSHTNGGFHDGSANRREFDFGWDASPFRRSSGVGTGESEDAVYRDHVQKDILDAKQLNSGCYMGRAKQVKNMLHFLNDQSEFYRDDQQQIVRYALSNPQLISIDLDKQYFRTAYRQFYDSPFVALTSDFSIISLDNEFDYSNRGSGTDTDFYGGHPQAIVERLTLFIRESTKSSIVRGYTSSTTGALTAVSLLHCNNKGSNSLYASFSVNMRHIYDAFYAKSDANAFGDLLLRLNWDIVDGNYDAVMDILYNYAPFRLIKCGNGQPIDQLYAYSRLKTDPQSPNVVYANTSSMSKVILAAYGLGDASLPTLMLFPTAVGATNDAVSNSIMVCYYRYKMNLILEELQLAHHYRMPQSGKGDNDWEQFNPTPEYLLHHIRSFVPIRMRMYN